MTLHEEQERVQKAVGNSLSYVKEDPWLTQRVLANAKGEEPVVKKITGITGTAPKGITIPKYTMPLWRI